MTDYGFTRELHVPFEETEAYVTEELKKDGFGTGVSRNNVSSCGLY